MCVVHTPEGKWIFLWKTFHVVVISLKVSMKYIFLKKKAKLGPLLSMILFYLHVCSQRVSNFHNMYKWYFVQYHWQQKVGSFLSRVKFFFWPPRALEFYTERSILRSPSAARRSKAKRGIKFQSEWGSKNEFQSRFLGYHFELQNVYWTCSFVQ